MRSTPSNNSNTFIFISLKNYALASGKGWQFRHKISRITSSPPRDPEITNFLIVIVILKILNVINSQLMSVR